MWFQRFNLNWNAFCAQKTKITLFNNFFTSAWISDVCSGKHRDSCVWCWCESTVYKQRKRNCVGKLCLFNSALMLLKVLVDVFFYFLTQVVLIFKLVKLIQHIEQQTPAWFESDFFVSSAGSNACKKCDCTFRVFFSIVYTPLSVSWSVWIMVSRSRTGIQERGDEDCNKQGFNAEQTEETQERTSTQTLAFDICNNRQATWGRTDY